VIAGTLPRSALALDITVNSQQDLLNAINAIDASTDASSIIRRTVFGQVGHRFSW
jgi:hypothetical protein